MKLPPFAYHRATCAEEVLSLLRNEGDAVKLLAGGQSLIPSMAFRLLEPALLVDINELGGLHAIEGGEAGTSIGALVRFAALECAAGLDGARATLREATRMIANYAVRTRGTVGGSLAHADPAAELCVVAVTLGGRVVLRSADGERRLEAADFFTGPYRCAMSPSELVVGLELPPMPPEAIGAFEEFRERAGGFAWASACVALARLEGRVTWARVGLGSVAPTPIRSFAAEQRLIGSEASVDAVAEAARLAAADCDPRSDQHAPAEYRRMLIEVLVRRALERTLAGDEGAG